MIGAGRERERIVGGMVGLAAGDALGLPVEFEPRSSRDNDPVASLRAAEAWKSEPGTWSDDTAISLCLAESIVRKGFDPEDFGRRALAWLDEGLWSADGRAIGAGGATRRSLDRVRSGMPAVLAGGRGENDNGNGALMRILPASIWLSSLPEPMRFRGIAAYTAVTHGHPRSILGSWLHCLLASRLLAGAAPAAAYAEAAEEARSRLPSMPEALRAEAGAYSRVLEGGLRALPASSIRGSGYVVHCLEASIWCLLRHDDFPSTVLAAVNLGEDSDTTGAVTGGLAGLAYGRSAIPEDWARGVKRSAEIEDMASSLAALAEAPAPLPRSYWVLPGKLLAGGYPGRGSGGIPAGADPGAPAPGPTGAAVEALRAAGIDAFLDLTCPEEEIGVPRYGPLAAAAAKSGEGRPLVLGSVPLPDMSAEAGEAARALAELDGRLSEGRAVYLHCVGGLGRTGTIVGSYLVEKGLAAPKEAIGVLKALRAGTDRAGTDAPQTEEQRRLVEGRRPGPSALAI